MKTTTTYQTQYQTQYQPKGGKPQGRTGYVMLEDLTTI
jgi:hypothetical protein